MPVITFDYNDFIKILGYKISKNELIEKVRQLNLGKIETYKINGMGKYLSLDRKR